MRLTSAAYVEVALHDVQAHEHEDGFALPATA
jgi:hypothetical protein